MLMAEYFVQKRGLSEEKAKSMFWFVVDHFFPQLTESPVLLKPKSLLLSSLFRLVDSKGLVAQNRGDKLPKHKVGLARSEPDVPRLKNLIDVVRYVKPVGLIGLSTVGGAFNEEVVRLMGEINERPIIFPLSNPSSQVRLALVGYPVLSEN
jgi:malic enzyme